MSNEERAVLEQEYLSMRAKVAKIKKQIHTEEKLSDHFEAKAYDVTKMWDKLNRCIAVRDDLLRRIQENLTV